MPKMKCPYCDGILRIKIKREPPGLSKSWMTQAPGTFPAPKEWHFYLKWDMVPDDGFMWAMHPGGGVHERLGRMVKEIEEVIKRYELKPGEWKISPIRQEELHDD